MFGIMPALNNQDDDLELPRRYIRNIPLSGKVGRINTAAASAHRLRPTPRFEGEANAMR
jgi:hypothetical protein